MRLALLLMLGACSGARPPPTSPSSPSADSSGATADTAPSDTASSIRETGSSPTGSDTGTSATGDTAQGCGPDCYFDPVDGECVFPTHTRNRSPMTDERIDGRVQTCGPLAVIVCDTGALGYAEWLGDETPTFEVYDATTREWAASFEEEDGGDISEACGASAFYGDPDQIPCLRELKAWLYGAYNAGQCEIWDGQTLGGKPDPCDNDPAVCIRDEWPR